MTRRQSKLSMSRSPVIVCEECHREFTLEEYFNHKDGLRNVPYGRRTLNLVQRFIFVPLMDAIVWILLNIFYREVVVVGMENVPETGPVVFYGNHQNQFIDALILRSQCGRDVRFIIAEKSMHRPIIGHFARLMNSVPVTRPQDMPATKGVGRIASIVETKVEGRGTAFTSIHVGDVLLVKNPGEEIKVQVQTIVSDTELTITQPLPVDLELAPDTDGHEYAVSSRIDNSEMYAEVFGTLARGNAIGIFPEGGSHDRPTLLPLKAGVALFSLGSAERGIVPKIIPFGLTYFYGHRFRSVAHIEFGTPVKLPTEMVTKFSKNKREATQEFLTTLDKALRSVTVNAPDWDTISFIHAFRRLFQPMHVVLPAKQYLMLFRRISAIVQGNPNHAGLAQFRANVERYTDKCSALFVRDAQVPTLRNIETRASTRLLVRRVILLLVIGGLLMPFIVIGLPIGYIARELAERHAESAKAASKVKLFGKDVKATYKLIIGFVLFPVMTLFLGLVAFFVDGTSTALTVMSCIPLVMYVSLHIGREWVLEFRAALPLFLSLLSNHKQFRPLFELRQTLAGQAWSLVAELDPSLGREVVGFATDRPMKEASLFSLRHVSRKDHEHDESEFAGGSTIPNVSSLTDLAALAAQAEALQKKST
eukprot:PhM_4_TR16493/c0_g1_i1/m.21353/K13507/GAT; glycerol-3-phosphate O-acyltransferase / dihydroxyacetone phosphate acyltransferase